MAAKQPGPALPTAFENHGDINLQLLQPGTRVLGDRNDSVIRGDNTPAAFTPHCPTCGEGTERRVYPRGAALAAAAAAAALFFVFVVGVAVGAAVASPWVGVGQAVAMAAAPCAMSV